MDNIKKYLAYEGRVQIICAETTELVEEARIKHDLSPVATAALGRLLTVGSIMGTSLKNKDESTTLQIKGNGPLGQLTCVTYGTSNVKGYVTNPQIDIPLKDNGKLDVGGAVGNEGFLYIIKDTGLKEPYIGITSLVSGEIAEDFIKYFSESEQKPGVIALGVLVDSKGVKKAGGYFITLMPDATEEDVNRLTNTVSNIKPISTMLEENMSLDEIAKTVTGDKNIIPMLLQINPKYECTCSKEKFLNGLTTLKTENIEEIFDKQENIETVCRFCNKKYYFTKEDILQD